MRRTGILCQAWDERKYFFVPERNVPVLDFICEECFCSGPGYIMIEKPEPGSCDAVSSHPDDPSRPTPSGQAGVLFAFFLPFAPLPARSSGFDFDAATPARGFFRILGKYLHTQLLTVRDAFFSSVRLRRSPGPRRLTSSSAAYCFGTGPLSSQFAAEIIARCVANLEKEPKKECAQKSY